MRGGKQRAISMPFVHYTLFTAPAVRTRVAKAQRRKEKNA